MHLKDRDTGHDSLLKCMIVFSVSLFVAFD